MVRVQIQADSRYPVDRSWLRAVVADFIRKEGLVTGVTVSIAIVGDRKNG